MTNPEVKHDPYNDQRIRQNIGLPCEYCGSVSGHFINCTLLNKQSKQDIKDRGRIQAL